MTSHPRLWHCWNLCEASAIRDTALADIIDNSIAAEATRISVRYLWNEGSPWLIISDNGNGMTADELIEAMRFGSKDPGEKRSPTDLGRFGLGLKTASISQCRYLTVISKTGVELSGCEWNLNAIRDGKTNQWNAGLLTREFLLDDRFLSPIVQEHLDTKKSGTVVIWRDLDKLIDSSGVRSGETAFSQLLDDCRRHLELVFHRFLSPGGSKRKVRMDFNGNELEAFNPFNPNHSAAQELPPETIQIDGQEVIVQPFVLPHQTKLSREEYERYAGPGGYLHNQGFYVYRNRRLIIKGTWFRLIKKEELNKLIRVRVDIPNTLDHIWKIDIKKSRASPPGKRS